MVGLEIAYLIKKLQQEHGLQIEDVHLIGHSLGAHTAGYAAERIPGIGRITGLDPAEPYFQGMGPSVRLDPSGNFLFFSVYSMSFVFFFSFLNIQRLTPQNQIYTISFFFVCF